MDANKAEGGGEFQLGVDCEAAPAGELAWVQSSGKSRICFCGRGRGRPGPEFCLSLSESDGALPTLKSLTSKGGTEKFACTTNFGGSGEMF